MARWHVIAEPLDLELGTPHESLRPRIFFVGEGPGEVEDLTGQPFRGPAGRILRGAIGQATEWCAQILDGSTLWPVPIYANLVACRPRNDLHGKNRAPFPAEVEACRPRLERLLEIFCPQVIVVLGRTPEAHFARMAYPQEHFDSFEYAHLQHPSYISRVAGNWPRCKDHKLYKEYAENIRKLFVLSMEVKNRYETSHGR